VRIIDGRALESAADLDQAPGTEMVDRPAEAGRHDPKVASGFSRTKSGVRL